MRGLISIINLLIKLILLDTKPLCIYFISFLVYFKENAFVLYNNGTNIQFSLKNIQERKTAIKKGLHKHFTKDD